ncbi:MAG: cation:proton antiporter [Bacillota bacterium]
MNLLEMFQPSASAIDKTEFILTVIIVLVAVKLAGDLSVRLGQPSVFGKLLVGLIVGPSLLGIVHETEMIKELSELGVLLLMFIAGVETDLQEFLKSAKSAALAAVLGVIAPPGSRIFPGCCLRLRLGNRPLCRHHHGCHQRQHLRPDPARTG